MSRATSKALVVVLCSLASSCAGMRFYRLPLSPSEGAQLVPALISTAQAKGLEAFRGPNGAVVRLPDSTMLSWQTSADDAEFILLVQLPGKTPEEEYDARFRAAQAEADEIWNLAVEQRRELMGAVNPTVIVQPASAPPYPRSGVQINTQRFSVGVTTP